MKMISFPQQPCLIHSSVSCPKLVVCVCVCVWPTNKLLYYVSVLLQCNDLTDSLTNKRRKNPTLRSKISIPFFPFSMANH